MPNFTFSDEKTSFYSGVKYLAEKHLKNIGGGYIWRIRMPFDNIDHPRNYLSKLQTYPKLYNNINSLSHRGDSAWACLQIATQRHSFGIYNIVNPGFMSTQQIVTIIRRVLKSDSDYKYFESDEEFYMQAAHAPRSNCLLDTSKIAKLDLKMRPIEDAIHDSVRNWVAAPLTTASRSFIEHES